MSSSIIDECTAFFGDIAPYLMDIGEKTIRLRVNEDELNDNIRQSAACYIYFSESGDKPIYAPYVHGGIQSGPRPIIGHEAFSFPDRFAISIEDRSNYSYGDLFIPRINKVYEEINHNNKLQDVLNRHLNINKIRARITPKITHDRMVSTVKHCIDVSVKTDAIDRFLTDILNETDTQLQKIRCEIRGVLTPNEIYQFFLKNIQEKIESRLEIAIHRGKTNGQLKSEFESSLHDHKTYNLKEIDNILSKLILEKVK
jgi:hypothetical protein